MSPACAYAGTWTLDWGDGSATINVTNDWLRERSHTYANWATYTINITYTCLGYSEDSNPKSVTLVQPTATPTATLVPLTVKFISLRVISGRLFMMASASVSAGIICTYSGAISGELHCPHRTLAHTSFAGCGTVSVTATATAGSRTASVTESVEVSCSPTATPTPLPAGAVYIAVASQNDPNRSVTVNITQTNCTGTGTWTLDWGDDESTSISSAYFSQQSHTYSDWGIYDIDLAYTCQGGSEAHAEADVALQGPTPTPSSTPTATATATASCNCNRNQHANAGPPRVRAGFKSGPTPLFNRDAQSDPQSDAGHGLRLLRRTGGGRLLPERDLWLGQRPAIPAGGGERRRQTVAAGCRLPRCGRCLSAMSNKASRSVSRRWVRSFSWMPLTVRAKQQPSTRYRRGDKTCGYLDRPGTLVLIPGEPTHVIAQPVPPTATLPPGLGNPYLVSDDPAAARLLADCRISSVQVLNVRVDPGRSSLGLVSGRAHDCLRADAALVPCGL